MGESVSQEVVIQFGRKCITGGCDTVLGAKCIRGSCDAGLGQSVSEENSGILKVIVFDLGNFKSKCI